MGARLLGETYVDPRADVYALGSVLFEILAGERLHPVGKSAAMASTITPLETRPSIRRPDRDIPPELDALTVDATELNRDDRIATARELGERIQQYLDGDRDLALRRSLAKTYHDHAVAAFSAGDRSKAMREAGRALALDPTLHAAGELITRMMLEPPTRSLDRLARAEGLARPSARIGGSAKRRDSPRPPRRRRAHSTYAGSRHAVGRSIK